MKGWSYWICFQALATVGWVLGWIVVPIALFSNALTIRQSRSPFYTDRPVRAWSWWWMLPWGNEEDGINARGFAITDVAIILWCCWRNPVNNMRLLPGAMVRLESVPVTTHYGPFTVCTYGWRRCLWIGKLRLGWLLRPQSAVGDYAWPVFSIE